MWLSQTRTNGTIDSSASRTKRQKNAPDAAKNSPAVSCGPADSFQNSAAYEQHEQQEQGGQMYEGTLGRIKLTLGSRISSSNMPRSKPWSASLPPASDRSARLSVIVAGNRAQSAEDEVHYEHPPQHSLPSPQEAETGSHNTFLLVCHLVLL